MRAAFQTMPVKTDAKDARKLRQAKCQVAWMTLRGFGLMVGSTRPRTLGARVHKPVDGHPTLEAVA